MKSCPKGCNWIPFPKSYVNNDGVRIELNSLASKIEKNTIIECLSKLIRKGKGLMFLDHYPNSSESNASQILYTLKRVFPNDNWDDLDEMDHICGKAEEGLVIFYVQDDYEDDFGVMKVENWAWYNVKPKDLEAFYKDPSEWMVLSSDQDVVSNPIVDDNEFFIVPIEFMKPEGPTDVEILTFLKKYEKL